MKLKSPIRDKTQTYIYAEGPAGQRVLKTLRKWSWPQKRGSLRMEAPREERGCPTGSWPFLRGLDPHTAPWPRDRPANPNGGRETKDLEDWGPTVEGWEGHEVLGDWGLNLPLPPMGCVDFGKGPPFLEPQFPHLCNGATSSLLPAHGPLWVLWCL